MKKPFIFINSAMSLDGKISTSEKKQVKISNEKDMERVDRLRAESDAILVGSNTVAIDDPKLTVKSERLRKERVKKGLPENPLKVMVGSIKEIKFDSDFLDYGNAEKIIFTTEKEDSEKIVRLMEKARVFVLGKKRVDLKKMVSILSDLGVKRIMVEGGGTLNFEMLKEGLVDEIYVAIAPKIFGGRNVPTLADGEGFKEGGIVDLELIDIEKLDEIIVLRYRILA
ncbi:MAG: 2,5-diamino-6-(ribosylamino)-4(3H)-pyrimidinone 5'-phosphate reductase [Candidatus Altiarchaeales archaeon]|mgnify:CR=1 FL=1|nr:MAG: 2,5-diamino-6-(ribosylamino)-4(3H)-pyrimidinone 5'-phosphate reductase [Candidatus Altiarchaeales archaeon]